MGALSRTGKRARERRTPWKGERWITGESYQELVKRYLTVGNLRGGISRKMIFFYSYRNSVRFQVDVSGARLLSTDLQ